MAEPPWSPYCCSAPCAPCTFSAHGEPRKTGRPGRRRFDQGHEQGQLIPPATRKEKGVLMITTRKAAIAAAIATSFAVAAPLAGAEDGTTLEVSVKDHQFQPAEFKAAAGTAI